MSKCTHMADGDSKSVYLKNTLTALRHQWKWSVAGHELSQGASNLDQPWDKLARSRECWERAITRDTELEVKTADAVKNLSRQGWTCKT